MREVVPAFLGREEIADVSHGFYELVEGPCADAAQELLEFGECHLDGVQVRTVGRKVQEPAALRSEGLGCAGILVGAEIVEDDDSATLKDWGKLGFDIDCEGGAIGTPLVRVTMATAVHGTRDDPRGDEGISGQPCDECLGAPAAKGRCGVQTLALRAAAPRPGHVGLDGGLIDEDQPVGRSLHRRQAVLYPVPAGAGDVRPALLVSHQRFFYM